MISMKGIILLTIGIVLLIFSRFFGNSVVDFQKTLFNNDIDEKHARRTCIVAGIFLIIFGVIELFHLLPIIDAFLKQ